MTLFTIVDDGYDVDVYKSVKSVVEFITGNELRLSEDSERAATDKEARNAVKNCEYVLYLYAEDFNGWKYRVERQNRVF